MPRKPTKRSRNQAKKPPQCNPRGTFKCPQCDRSFTRSEHRSRHQRIHSEIRPYECNRCSSNFFRRDLLIRHLRMVHHLELNKEDPLPPPLTKAEVELQAVEIIDRNGMVAAVKPEQSQSQSDTSPGESNSINISSRELLSPSLTEPEEDSPCPLDIEDDCPSANAISNTSTIINQSGQYCHLGQFEQYSQYGQFGQNGQNGQNGQLGQFCQFGQLGQLGQLGQYSQYQYEDDPQNQKDSQDQQDRNIALDQHEVENPSRGTQMYFSSSISQSRGTDEIPFGNTSPTPLTSADEISPASIFSQSPPSFGNQQTEAYISSSTENSKKSTQTYPTTAVPAFPPECFMITPPEMHPSDIESYAPSQSQSQFNRFQSESQRESQYRHHDQLRDRIHDQAIETHIKPPSPVHAESVVGKLASEGRYVDMKQTQSWEGSAASASSHSRQCSLHTSTIKEQCLNSVFPALFVSTVGTTTTLRHLHDTRGQLLGGKTNIHTLLDRFDCNAMWDFWISPFLEVANEGPCSSCENKSRPGTPLKANDADSNDNPVVSSLESFSSLFPKPVQSTTDYSGSNGFGCCRSRIEGTESSQGESKMDADFVQSLLNRAPPPSENTSQTAPYEPSSADIDKYVRLYFSNMHHWLPILHPQTFRPAKVFPPLLFAVCAVGALICRDSGPAEVFLNQSLTPLREWIEKDRKNGLIPLNTGGQRLKWDQVAIITCLLLSMRESQRENIKKREAIEEIKLYLHRSLIMPNPAATDSINSGSYHGNFMLWIEREQIIRTHYMNLVLQACLSVSYGFPISLQNYEVDLLADIPLPCPERHWNAKDIQYPERWLQQVEKDKMAYPTTWSELLPLLQNEQIYPKIELPPFHICLLAMMIYLKGMFSIRGGGGDIRVQNPKLARMIQRYSQIRICSQDLNEGASTNLPSGIQNVFAKLESAFEKGPNRLRVSRSMVPPINEPMHPLAMHGNILLTKMQKTALIDFRLLSQALLQQDSLAVANEILKVLDGFEISDNTVDSIDFLYPVVALLVDTVRFPLAFGRRLMEVVEQTPSIVPIMASLTIHAFPASMIVVLWCLKYEALSNSTPTKHSVLYEHLKCVLDECGWIESENGSSLAIPLLQSLGSLFELSEMSPLLHVMGRALNMVSSQVPEPSV